MQDRSTCPNDVGRFAQRLVRTSRRMEALLLWQVSAIRGWGSGERTSYIRVDRDSAILYAGRCAESKSTGVHRVQLGHPYNGMRAELEQSTGSGDLSFHRTRGVEGPTLSEPHRGDATAPGGDGAICEPYARNPLLQGVW